METYVHMFAAWQSLGIVRLPLKSFPVSFFAWRRHQMEIFSASLALCVGISPVNGEFPWQRPVTRRFNVFFYLRLNKRLSKQSWGWWFETSSRSLWRHCGPHFLLYFSRLDKGASFIWLQNSTLYFKISLSLWWGPRVLCNGEDINYSRTQSNKKSTYCTA